MDKKELKMYVSPEMEILEQDVQASLLAGSVTIEDGEWDE